MKFSKASDVWSYGVTMWEVLTRREPYEDKDNVTAAGDKNSNCFTNFLKKSEVMYKGLKPTIPVDCPTRLATLLNSCFEFEPHKRPTFKFIIKQLNNLEGEWPLIN